jgi:hypothetical protein
MRWKTKVKGIITAVELVDVELRIIEIVQRIEFSQDIRYLQMNGTVSNRSKIKSLQPFMDENILRVGGWLKNANITDEERHPIILPKKHPLTSKIIDYAH